MLWVLCMDSTIKGLAMNNASFYISIICLYYMSLIISQNSCILQYSILHAQLCNCSYRRSYVKLPNYAY